MALDPLTLGTLVWTVVAAGHGQRGTALAAGTVAVLAAAALVVAERRAAAPVVPGGLLRAPAFLGANGIALIMNLVTNGVLFVAALQLQQAQHRPALAAGALLLPMAVPPMAVPLVLLAPVSGWLTARFGTRVPLTAGTLVAGTLVAGTLVAGAGSLWLLAAGRTPRTGRSYRCSSASVSAGSA